MKNSTIAWIVIVVVLVAASMWYFSSPSPAQPTSTTGVATTTTAVPGDNLTLGQDSNTSVGRYLIGYNGMTLYTYAPDASGVSNCTGACATNWPPYVVTSTDNLVGEYPISGTIATLTRADGSVQVTYNGHPLYFYVGDSASGDVKGQGVGGVWYAAKP